MHVAVGLVHGHHHRKWSPGALPGPSVVSDEKGMRRARCRVQLHHLLGGQWKLFGLVSSSKGVVPAGLADTGRVEWNQEPDTQDIRSNRKGALPPAICSHLLVEEERLKTQWAGWTWKVLADSDSKVSARPGSWSPGLGQGAPVRP